MVLSILLYALFLIPTLIWLVHGGPGDSALSRHIGETWQAGFWHMPGLSAKATRVLLDILEIPVVAALAFLFFKGAESVAANEDAVARKLVLRWTLICGLILLAVVPFHSSDLYGYLNRGFQQSLYHTNPYLTPVAEISGWERQPLLHAHWIYNPCPYGFFFAWLAAAITRLSGALFVPAFLMLKSLNLLALLGSVQLIGSLSEMLNRSRPWRDAFLLGANPLVLLHAMGNGHNDIQMAFLLLLALRLLLSTRWAWLSLPVLVLSVLLKYASLLALPFMLLYLLKTRQFRTLALGLLPAALLVVALALPYVDPYRPWPWNALLDNAGKPQHSLVDMLAQLVCFSTLLGSLTISVLKPAVDTVLSIPFQVHNILGIAPGAVAASTRQAEAVMTLALKILKPAFWGGFVLFYAWQCGCFLRLPMPDRALLTDKTLLNEALLKAVALTLTVMIAFISAKFHPWYIVMFLPILLLLPETSRLRRFGLLFSLFQLAAFTILQNLPVFNVILLTLLPLWLTFRNKDPKVI